MLKCLVCGAVFEDDVEVCPVCGVGKENFVPVEEKSKDFKKNTEEIVLILGNGAAGVSAAEAVRERNETCSIVLVGNEGVNGYNRPMLTKTLSKGTSASEIAIHDEAWYQERNILTLSDKTAKHIDTDQKEVLFEDGIRLKYDKCIYAMGSECFIPPIPGREKPEVVSIRRIADTDRVRELLKDVRSAAIIGGGVLGLEAAWELKKAGCSVTILEMAPQLMGRQLDERGSALLKKIIVSKGIEVKTSVSVEAIEGGDHVTGVRLVGGELVEAGLVLISAGVRANIAVAKASGIETDRAVVVNAHMETSASDVYACGDCAQFESINYGIWPQAVSEGKTAGANAAGEPLLYKNEPAALTFNGMETSLYAIGDNGKNSDISYREKEFFDEEKNTYEKYYFADNHLVGVILMGDISNMAKVMDAMEKHSTYEELFG